jgi:hypothetical protein
MSTSESDLSRSSASDSSRLTGQHDFENREPEYLERDIDATRADLRATLSALERRFSVDRLVEMTVGRIRDRGGEFAGNLSDVAARNPIPLLLTSVGVAWMMMSGRDGIGIGHGSSRSSGIRDRASDAVDRVSSTAERVGDQVRNAFESSRETLSGATDSLRSGAESLHSSASRAASATREQVDHARERMDRLLHEQPLIIGALGLAAGAIIGALLPASETEQQLIGDVRDKAMRKVTETSRKVAETSRQRYEAARESAATYSAPTAGMAEDEERPSRPH